MQVSSMYFKPRAKQKLNDPVLQKALAGLQERSVPGRAQVIAELDNFEEIREAAKEIRNRALANLDLYLERFEREATARGAVVQWAQTASEVNRIVNEIAERHQVRKIIKSKSMVTEECSLNEALQAAGIEVIETDLGEYILQLAHEPPSHIVMPVIHKSKDEVSDLFEEKHQTARKTGVPELCREAREQLRPHFLSTDMGISGANFFVAETGTTLIVTNEGNGRLVTTLPRVHVAITGIEKVVPTLEDVATLLRLLPRSATGQAITNYVSFTTGVRAPGESDGPEYFYVILVDGHASYAPLHPLRRVHESLPRVPERGWPRLRLGLSRAHGLDSHPKLCRARKRARPAARLDALQPVRRGVPGQDPASRPHAETQGEAIRAAIETLGRGDGTQALGLGRGESRILRAGVPLGGMGVALRGRQRQAAAPAPRLRLD
jgi:L-lactate utilization protein LutC